MAAQSIGANSVANLTPDLVKLHMRAVNLLNRCKTLILADEPMYTFALQDLDEVRKAFIQLAAAESNTAN